MGFNKFNWILPWITTFHMISKHDKSSQNKLKHISRQLESQKQLGSTGQQFGHWLGTTW
jgi:hypothetical protein